MRDIVTCSTAAILEARISSRETRSAMPRDNYVITSDDEFHATFYLSGRLRNYGFKFRDSVSSAQAEGDYRAATSEKTKSARAGALNVWCERYLSKADWRRLKTAVRKRRERWRRSEETKTVTLSAKAHNLLTQVSKRDNVTFSQALEHYLSKVLNSARGSAGGRKSR